MFRPVKQESQFHSYICTLNIKLQPVAVSLTCFVKNTLGVLYITDMLSVLV